MTRAVCAMAGVIQQRGRNSGCRTHSAYFGVVTGMCSRLPVETLLLAGAEALHPSQSREGRKDGPRDRDHGYNVYEVASVLSA